MVGRRRMNWRGERLAALGDAGRDARHRPAIPVAGCLASGASTLFTIVFFARYNPSCQVQEKVALETFHPEVRLHLHHTLPHSSI
jgi:hypothetical protein